MAKFILFLFTLLLPVTIFSQAIVNPVTSTEERFKSPQVHLLKEFVDHPIDLSRGLADITIPLYDIKYEDKTIPIKLMFHASGLKANAAENGMLGLKWALNAGGFISREVKGMPDEQRNHKQGIGVGYVPDWMTLYGGGADRGYLNNNFVFQNYDLSYIGMPGVYGKYEDTEYDIFTYSLPNGQSGKFILKDNDGNKSAAFMPYKPFKLNNPTVEFTNYVKFEIIDDEGYTYSFGKNDVGNYYWEFDREGKYINTWMLTSITSPNKKEVIKFDYNFTTVDGNSPLVPVVINDNLQDYTDYIAVGTCGLPNDSSILFDVLKDIIYDHARAFQTDYNATPFHVQDVFYPSKITYNDLSVNFTYKERGSIILLDKIEVVKENRIIKKVNFDIQTPGYLNSLNIMGSTDEIIEKYKFDYYHLDKLPPMEKLANRADYWGYYQSEVENVILKDTVNVLFTYPGCTPVEAIFKEEVGGGAGRNFNRYSIPEDMKIGMVKSITYPTGGSTTFDYDGNQYRDGNTTIECGGLRIKSIIDKDKNGNELKKREYKYGQNEDGIGIIPSYLKPDVNVRNSYEEAETMYFINDDVQPNISWGDTGTYTTRYITGFFPGNYYTFLYNLVAYSKVTEYYGDSINNIGKIENYYNTNIPLYSDYEFDYNNFKYQRSKHIIDHSNFWQDNNLSQKIEYKTENGLYSKVKQTDYFYGGKIIDEIYDLSIFTFKNFVGFCTSGATPFIPSIQELELVKYNPREFFGYKTQKYTIGAETLNAIREESFFNDGKSIVQETVNKYDTNKTTYLKENSTTTSKGDNNNIIQKFIYPFDINTGVYSEMTQANVISPLIEKVTLKNDKVISSALLTYKKSDNNFVPDRNHVTELNTPIPYSGFTNFNGSSKDSHYNVNPENTYDLYDDYGNPKQITSKGKITTCYVWGYNKKYPIAKIENATYTTGLPNSITEAQQALIDNAVLAAVGETTQATEINLITKLKLLRAGFPDAMVTTFTYDPSIGITSMTDPKDYTTYYEYDVFSRLKQVKDNDSKIISANEYHYKN